jgi:hypothetical protein
MSVLTQAVTSADKSRRILRDTKRKEFFSDHDLEEFNDPYSLDLDPAAQLSVVMYLLDQSIEKHMDETSAITALRLQLDTLFLGVSTKKVTSCGRPVVELMKPECWQFGIFNSGG